MVIVLRIATPPKTNEIMEKHLCEDVSPMKNGDFTS